MRLGAPISLPVFDPAAWIAAVRAKGYRAAYCPLTGTEDAATLRACEHAARQAELVIAEVGAWGNPLSPDEPTRRAALAKCQAMLALADEVGARCCVNIAGSRGVKWDGPHPADLSPETFDMIVQSVRAILDAVKPRRTFYTLETMPWMYPDSVESYLDLIAAIDRPRFGVHFDPVNLVNNPLRYFHNADLMREFIARLGPFIRSVHAKDILLQERLTVHLDEMRPGLGRLDYRTLLVELDRLDADLPLMLEHLPAEGEYDLAAAYLRAEAGEVGVEI
jgi:sugar phosphate isomerase/epimerase